MTAWTRACLVLLVLLGLGSCSSESRQESAPVPDQPQAADDVVRLGLTDWTIETGEGIAAGERITVVVTNVGGTAHDVLIRGEHGVWGTPVLAPGEVHELQISAEAGEILEMVCTVTGHRAAGMHTQVRVADAPDE